MIIGTNRKTGTLFELRTPLHRHGHECPTFETTCFGLTEAIGLGMLLPSMVWWASGCSPMAASPNTPLPCIVQVWPLSEHLVWPLLTRAKPFTKPGRIKSTHYTQLLMRGTRTLDNFDLFLTLTPPPIPFNWKHQRGHSPCWMTKSNEVLILRTLGLGKKNSEDFRGHLCINVGIDRHACLVCLVLLQTDNLRLFLCQQTDKQQTSVCARSKW